MMYTRRQFVSTGAALAAAVCMGRASAAALGSKMRFGLVTYLWGQHWDLPTLIANCATAGALGVELRVEHKHGVEPTLNAAERTEVKKRFADSPVTCLGMGTNQQYDYVAPEELKKSIEMTKEYIKLSHDIGASGVKVKPNAFHAEVPKEQTIEQIGKALNEVGAFGADFGQQIRLEVHGKETQELPNIKAMMDIADNRNVTVCWNSNDQDLIGEGLVYNFNLVKDRLGATTHVRELNLGDYPYQDLFNLMAGIDYDGWVLLEARTDPEDKLKALTEQREVWDTMLAKAQAAAAK